jgi:mannitol-1-phosphate/altronate dehydrogenase
MVGQTETLGKFVRQYLSDEENAYTISFANYSVDRIVPAPPPTENPLDVGVEYFSEWAADLRALRTLIDPPVRGMTLTDALPSASSSCSTADTRSPRTPASPMA